MSLHDLTMQLYPLVSGTLNLEARFKNKDLFTLNWVADYALQFVKEPTPEPGSKGTLSNGKTICIRNTHALNAHIKHALELELDNLLEELPLWVCEYFNEDAWFEDQVSREDNDVLGCERVISLGDYHVLVY